MPVYLDLAETLRQRIQGDYHPGDQLPIQTALAAEFGVGLATVHRAVEVLKHEGTVYTTHAGTFVSPRPADPRRNAP